MAGNLPTTKIYNARIGLPVANSSDFGFIFDFPSNTTVTNPANIRSMSLQNNVLVPIGAGLETAAEITPTDNFSLYGVTLAAATTNFSMQLRDIKGNLITTITPGTAAATLMGNLIAGTPYLLYGNAQAIAAIPSNTQLGVVSAQVTRSVVPDYFEQELTGNDLGILPTGVTVVTDSFGQWTFTFTNVSLVLFSRYQLGRLLEGQQSGTVNLVSSVLVGGLPAFTSPIAQPFAAGSGVIIEPQANIGGIANGTVAITITGVGIATPVNLEFNYSNGLAIPASLQSMRVANLERMDSIKAYIRIGDKLAIEDIPSSSEKRKMDITDYYEKAIKRSV